jgi:hypothetical protein
MTDTNKSAFFMSQAAKLFGVEGEEMKYYTQAAFEHNVTAKVMKVLGYDLAAIRSVQHRHGLEDGLLTWDCFIELFDPFPFKVRIVTLPKKEKTINLTALFIDFPKSKLYKLWRKNYNEFYDFVITDAHGFASSGGLVIGWVSEQEVLRRRSGSVLFGTAALRSKEQEERTDLDHCIVGTLQNVLEYLVDAELIRKFDRQLET